MNRCLSFLGIKMLLGLLVFLTGIQTAQQAVAVVAPVAAVEGDFTGNGKRDAVVYDSASYTFHIRGGNPASVTWGFAGVIPLTGDFNGNGLTDVAVYDPATANWFLRGVPGGFGIHWGFQGVIPVAADFDGDGVTDLGVYHPPTGTWFVRKVSGEILLNGVVWGYAGTIPIVADYNGNGQVDLGVYHAFSGRWHVMSQAGHMILPAEGVQWGGFNNATPFAADVSGNGQADLLIYNGNDQWHMLEIASGIAQNISWGFRGTQAVVGDFIGDAAGADLAHYNPVNGMWYILNVSGAGETASFNWGYAGASAVGAGIPSRLHLPILTRGEDFLYKPSTHLVLLPARMRPNGSTPVNRVVFSRDPMGEQVIRALQYTGNFGARPKWRFYGTRGSSLGNNFYVVAFFRDGSPPQPYLIFRGGARQGQMR